MAYDALLQLAPHPRSLLIKKIWFLSILYIFNKWLNSSQWLLHYFEFSTENYWNLPWVLDFWD